MAPRLRARPDLGQGTPGPRTDGSTCSDPGHNAPACCNNASCLQQTTSRNTRAAASSQGPTQSPTRTATSSASPRPSIAHVGLEQLRALSQQSPARSTARGEQQSTAAALDAVLEQQCQPPLSTTAASQGPSINLFADAPLLGAAAQAHAEQVQQAHAEQVHQADLRMAQVSSWGGGNTFRRCDRARDRRSLQLQLGDFFLADKLLFVLHLSILRLLLPKVLTQR